MKKPKIHDTKIIYDGFFRVHEDILERRDGSHHIYASLILHLDAAIVLAQDKEGRWIVTREYRHPTGEFLLSCPGGRLEPGEHPIQGGQRELFEETGYWSDEIQLLAHSYPFPGICNQRIYYLFAKNAYRKGEPRLDPSEVIETELKTDAELKKEIKSGLHIDSILCTALYYKHLFD